MKFIIGHYRKCDLLTMTSLVLAFIGILFATYDEFTISIFLLMACGICDAFDGVLARSKEYTEEQKCYGVQLDSLNDIVAFGVYPAIINALLSDSILGMWSSIIFVLAGLIRLAYFNMLAETKQNKKNKYIGLPITTISIIMPLFFFTLKLIDYSIIKNIMPIILTITAILFVLRIEIPKVNVPKVAKNIFNKYIINYLIFPIFLIIGTDIFYKLTFRRFTLEAIIQPIRENFGAYVIIFVLVDLLYVLLQAILKTSKRSKIAILILFIILMVINEIKYKIMGIPIEITDISYLTLGNATIMGAATGSIGIWIWTTIIKTLIFTGIGLLFVFFDNTISINFNKKLRIIGGISATILIVLLCFLIMYNPEKSINKIYNLDVDGVLALPKNHKVYYDYGFFPGLLLDHLGKKINEPINYSYKEAKASLESSYSHDDSWGKANVVFILSEAFFDITQIEEIKFDKDLLEHVHKLEKDNKIMVSDLLVTPFGGKSANTEFEVLTGANLNFWKEEFIPYNQYYDNTNLKFSPNLIKEFNNNGYETMYITLFEPDLYRSKYVYDRLGVDKNIYGRDLKCDVKGYYCSDESFFDIIFDELKSTSVGNYKFIMSATGQNHFPFEADKYYRYDINIKETTLNAEDATLLRTYAQGIYDADKAIYQLYNDIQKLDTPTIVVYFGDHLPYIVNKKGKSSYLNTKYFNDELKELKEYTSKAMIFANYDIAFEDIEYINSSYLGAYVANKMDIELSNYFKFIDYTRTLVPVFNRNHYYDIESGNLKDISEVEDTLKTYQNVQYMSFYDYKG